MRTRIILLAVFLVLAAPVAAADWQKQKSGSLAWLYAVQFLDANTGFAAGSNGTLLVTRDAGGKWEKVILPITDTIRDVHFLDGSNGWLLCDRGNFRSGHNGSYLMRTSDAGRTWSTIEFKDSPERFGRLFFLTDGTGHLIGEGGIMVALPNGEAAEARSILPLRFLMTDGAAVGGSRIVLAGGGGSVIISDDGGRSWQASRFADERPSEKINAIFFADDRFGWIAGRNGLVFLSADGGRSWNAQDSGTRSELADIAFYDRRRGFAVGDSGIILSTEDSGARWSRDKSGVRHRLERLAFAGRRAIAVGFGGTIISTDLP